MKKKVAVTFDELPPEFQEAAREHLGGIAGNQIYGYGVVTLKWLANEAAKIYGTSVREFLADTFRHQESKDDYQYPPAWAKHDPDSIWPIFLSAPPGGPYGDFVIEDGLHRFMYYMDQYRQSQKVPILWVTPYRVRKALRR